MVKVSKEISMQIYYKSNFMDKDFIWYKDIHTELTQL